MQDGLLAKALHLILDIYFAAVDAALHADSQITVLKYVHCQKLHVDNTPITITNGHVRKCSVCGKNWYEIQMVSGNPLVPLGIKMLQ